MKWVLLALMVLGAFCIGAALGILDARASSGGSCRTIVMELDDGSVTSVPVGHGATLRLMGGTAYLTKCGGW